MLHTRKLLYMPHFIILQSSQQSSYFPCILAPSLPHFVPSLNFLPSLSFELPVFLSLLHPLVVYFFPSLHTLPFFSSTPPLYLLPLSSQDTNSQGISIEQLSSPMLWNILNRLLVNDCMSTLTCHCLISIYIFSINSLL